MENLILAFNIVSAILLILVILFQKSEGGALGIGASQDSFISSRAAGNFLTKTTSILATLFIVSSILLTISVIDYKAGIIPLQLILFALLGLLFYIYCNPSEWQISLWGAIMGVGYLSLIFLLTSALFNKQTLGLGDLQLIAITGMWLGPVNVLLSIFASALLSLIIWVVISLFDGFDRNRSMPFGPYLSCSAIILYILDLDLLAYLSNI